MPRFVKPWSVRVVGLAVVTWLALAGCSKGRCGKCAKDSDCSSGLRCDTDLGVCKSLDDKGKNVCPADCLASEGCKAHGRCTLKGAECVIASDS